MTLCMDPSNASSSPDPIKNESITHFLAHLTTERGASAYTLRNYRHSLEEFYRWHQDERHDAPAWDKLQRDDFRAYLRFLGRQSLSRSATQLRFSALRS